MITVHCDGSSTGRSNREGGWAYVICIDDEPIACNYGGDLSTTNNLMEMEAAIQGLRALSKINMWYPGEQVTLVSDSMYCLGTASGKLAASKNLEKVAELRELYKSVRDNTRWVKGHAGDPMNMRCDSLAKRGKLEVLSKAGVSND